MKRKKPPSPLFVFLPLLAKRREKREYIADSLGKLCSPLSKVSVLMEGTKVAIVYWAIGESRERLGLPREKKTFIFRKPVVEGLRWSIVGHRAGGHEALWWRLKCPMRWTD